jgi:cytochrome c553
MILARSMRSALRVGWAKRSVPTVTAGSGWARFALPTLQMLAVLLAAVPLAAAQSIEDKAQACAACHGDAGIPPDKSWPVIWGQHQGYLYLQLRDFKSGARKNDVMGPIAQPMERDDMLALALYFSQKAWPNLRQPRAPETVAAQAVRTNGSVGCTGCHQAGYLGEGTQPRLAGQSADYLLKSMMDFRTRARGNNPGMSDLMNATSEDDIKALAQYLAGL